MEMQNQNNNELHAPLGPRFPLYLPLIDDHDNKSKQQQKKKPLKHNCKFRIYLIKVMPRLLPK